MSTYRINEEELRKAIVLMDHITSKLDSNYRKLNAVYGSISKQTGGKMGYAKNTLLTQKEVVRIQKDSIVRIRECVQSIINSVYDSAEIARKELERVDLSKTLIETAVISGASAVSVGNTNKNTVNNGSPNIDQRSSIKRVAYYNLKVYGDNDPRNYYARNASCNLNAYTMVFNGMGIDVDPVTVYYVNGNNSVEMRYDDTFFFPEYGNVNVKRIELNGNGADKKNQAYRLLESNPQGIVLMCQGHSVYAYLDDNGEIKINDPGKIWQNSNGEYQENGTGIDITKTWQIGSWDRVETVRVFTKI